MIEISTPCREYQGYRSRLGYGKRSWASTRFGTALVHRQIMLMMGHDIEGLVVMHLCDNPACFRYDHLRIGTQADNAADMAAKGRGTKGRIMARTPIPHGTTNGYARHCYYRDTPCQPCRDAVAAYNRAARTRRAQRG